MLTSRPIRCRCDLTCRLELPSGGVSPARVLDLSLAGAFIETDLELELGDTASLGIELPGVEPWRAGVRVVRLGSGQRELAHPRVERINVTRLGVAVAFEDVSRDQLERLRELLQLLDER